MLEPTCEATGQQADTEIKSINDPLDIVLELRQQLQDKKIPGPRLLTAGPAFTAPDGHPAISLAANDPWLRGQLTIEVDNADVAREAVRNLAAKRLDAIKLIYQGGEAEDRVRVPGREYRL